MSTRVKLALAGLLVLSGLQSASQADKPSGDRRDDKLNRLMGEYERAV